jgi:hypothetical protein
MKSDQLTSDREPFMTLASGRIRCSRCQALSKRTKRQCGAPAIKGKRVCRFHGGKSTGPMTEEGRKRCGIAKTVHGGETRAIRAARPAKMAELKVLGKIIEKW